MPPLDLTALRRERYADAENLVIDWLTDAMAEHDPPLHFGNEMPAPDELAERLPFVLVSALPGAEVNPAQDRVPLDVEVIVGPDADGNPDTELAVDVANLLRAALLFHLPGHHTSDATVSSVATNGGPHNIPDDNPEIRKRGATYTLVIKSHA